MPLSTASACMYCSCEISKEITACGSAGKLTLKMKKILDVSETGASSRDCVILADLK